MSCYHISIVSGRKQAQEVRNLEEYLALRSTSQQMKNLSLARNGDNKAKMRLVQFNYSGHYPSGVIKGVRLPSKAFGFDIDDPEAFLRASQVLLQEPERYGLLMLERSVRQGGHAVFKREMGKTILENQVRIATQLQCEMDTSAHDINRVYFSTSASREELLYVCEELFQDHYNAQEVEKESILLQEREAYSLEEVPPQAHKVDKHFRPWLLSPTPAPSSKPIETPKLSVTENNDALEYMGIKYSDIVRKWWEMYNDGMEPVRSNRDTLTFELAVNLRHICGFDREILNTVIPCYDDFPLEQKLKCIDSALNERRTQIPKRLKDLLAVMRAQKLKSEEPNVEALDEVFSQDNLFHYNALPKMPMGVRESIDAVGHSLTMPILTAICPAIGTLATGVELDVHGTSKGLNLIAYIAGDFASGKGKIDPVIETWMNEVRATDKIFIQKHEEWRELKRSAKNKKEQPIEPRLPVRMLTFNNTVANLAERLANTDGKHAFSFTPEADTVAQKWRSAMSDFSIMLRQSYDGSLFEREARSVEAVNVHIEHLLWNVTMCGTPDALYRVVSNYTDGFQSRIAIARTPDNTFAPLEEKPCVLTPQHQKRIRQVAHLLPLMQGKVVLPKLEQKGRQWVENIRLETMKNDDTVMARQRFRVCVTAQRMMCCIMLCKVCEDLIEKYGVSGAETSLKQDADLWKKLLIKSQTPALLKAYDVIADALLENALFFFREKIENAFNADNYKSHYTYTRVRRGKNDSIFERLDTVFTFDQALQQTTAVKGCNATQNNVQQMLKNWRNQGLISKDNHGNYTKCH